MGELVNFRNARKAAERSRREQEAAANRLKHGSSKADRNLTAARAAKARRDLDQHRLDQPRLDTGDER
jgi:chromosomal replication initiation ATPase DnaA